MQLMLMTGLVVIGCALSARFFPNPPEVQASPGLAGLSIGGVHLGERHLQARPVCYAGAFANTLQMLSVPKNGPEAVATPTPTPQSRRTKWAALILRTWQVDPELCPKCRQKMTRGKTIFERAELNKILKALRIGDYPKRHRSPPPPEDDASMHEPDFDDNHSQVPPDWDDWAAA